MKSVIEMVTIAVSKQYLLSKLGGSISRTDKD